MALFQQAIFLSIGVTLIVAGGYFLSFRPRERRLVLLAAYLLGNGVWYFVYLVRPGLDLATMLVGFASYLILFAFLALTPTPLRPRGWAALAYALALVWVVGATVYLASGRWTHEGQRDVVDGLFAPGFLGAAFPTVLILALRLRESGTRTDAATRGFRLMLVGIQARLLVAAGLVAAQTVLALGGLALYPHFLYVPTPLALTGAFLAYYVLGAGALAFFEWRYARSRLGVLLLFAGVLTALSLVVAPPDTMSPAYARSWSFIAEPAIILYAQARYGVFEGEPTAVRPTLIVTVLSGLFVYLFAFGVVATLMPAEIATIGAPVVALAAAIGVALVVLPRARKAQLRRIIDADTMSPGISAGDLVLGRYRVERFLAEGGQGRVYEATDRDTGRRVVLKALANDQAMAEARVLSKLRHPNIVGFVEIVEVTGATLLVTEHELGGDLRSHLARRGTLSLSEAGRIMDGVLAGLAEAHRQGIAHRDVKPENVLIAEDGTPKLADFGSAREARPDATMKAAGLGTLAYLAPEQVRGEAGDARSDVYAAGILLHELLTGERPIATHGKDDFLVRREILAGVHSVALPNEAARLAPVIERAIAMDPEDRPQDAETLRAAIQDASGARTLQSTVGVRSEASGGTA